MKRYISITIFFLAISLFQDAAAQTKALKLSDAFPAAGKKIQLTYDQSVTPLAGSDSITATIFCLTEYTYKPIELGRIAVNKDLKASFTVPAAAKALLFRFSKDTITDRNNGEGYLYPVYNNQLPVKGALGSMAKVYSVFNNVGRLPVNYGKALDLLEKELTAYPKSVNQFGQVYVNVFYNTKDEAEKKIIEKKIIEFAASKEEGALIAAQQYYRQVKQVATADSLKAIARKSFPLGDVVKDERAALITEQKAGIEKEKLYRKWAQDFPPKAGAINIQYDYIQYNIALSYAEEGNTEKAMEFIKMGRTDLWRGNAYSGLAAVFLKQEKLKEAEILLKLALANAKEFKDSRKNEEGAGFASSAYYPLNSSFAELLLKQKKYSEALPYVDIAYKNAKPLRGSINANYARILMALGRNEEAFEKIDEAVKEGQATAEMKEDLKKLYPLVKGSDQGFDAYMVSVNKILAEKIRKDLAKQIINIPAPAFTLSDVDGRLVSLSDLKGKTVVVDFWATWCGPCKASFPAMRTAVNRYKDDPNVKFLFVHTWERGDSAATKNAKKYVVDNKYPFEVLMDLAEPQTGSNKVVESFKVSGIPTKFVIDKNGNIRFKFTGFSGGEDAAVEEVAAMIELASS